MTYVPLALSELKDDFKAKPAAQTSQTAPDTAVSVVATPQDTTAANPTPADPAATPTTAAVTITPKSDNNQVGAGKFILACGTLLLLAYTLPFLAGIQNILGLIILAIGLYQAWKLNKGRRIDINGPYRAGPPKNQPPPMQ